MRLRKFCLLFAAGGILLFFGAAQATQYRFKPPVNLGPPINTTFNERDPWITADGQKLFFASDYPDGNGDIWMSTWSGTNWGTPVNCGPNVNSGLIEWSPSTSPNGKRLYFIAFGRPGGYGGWDVWYSDWDEGLQQWGAAQNMGPVINTPVLDWCPEVSRNGQGLYYTTEGYGHGCGGALYVSRWNGSSWNTPEPLPLHINQTCTEDRPSLTVDEKTMYFVRQTVDYQGRSIWVTEKDSFGNWSQPVILDSLINSFYPNNSSDPAISPDGRFLYFASGRSGGVGIDGTADIWVVERIDIQRIPTLRPSLLSILVLILIITASFWIKRKKLKPT
jgi:Tol biopolymer transport system component